MSVKPICGFTNYNEITGLYWVGKLLFGAVPDVLL